MAAPLIFPIKSAMSNTGLCTVIDISINIHLDIIIFVLVIVLLVFELIPRFICLVHHFTSKLVRIGRTFITRL